MIFVTANIDEPPRSGGALRAHRLLQGLAARTPTHLVVVGELRDPGALVAATGVQDLTVFPRLDSSWAKRAAAVRHRWPLAVARVWQPELAKWLQAHQQGVVVLDHLRLAGYRDYASRFVLNLHDCETQMIRSATVPLPPLRAADHYWERKTTPNFERRAVRDARGITVAVSETDAACLGADVHVVPNGADIPAFVPEAPSHGSVLFVGSLSHAPNREAIAWWANSVWPRLDRRVPRLRVVGSGRVASLGRLGSHESLDVVGEVDDIASEMANASMVAVPLRSGSGTRVKILEAFAWRRPVVTTAKGAEGLPLQHGREALVADDPQAFADAVQSVYLGDRGSADELAEAGREFVQAYDWRGISERFADLVLRFDAD